MRFRLVLICKPSSKIYSRYDQEDKTHSRLCRMGIRVLDHFNIDFYFSIRIACSSKITKASATTDQNDFGKSLSKHKTASWFSGSLVNLPLLPVLSKADFITNKLQNVRNEKWIWQFSLYFRRYETITHMTLTIEHIDSQMSPQTQCNSLKFYFQVYKLVRKLNCTWLRICSTMKITYSY